MCSYKTCQLKKKFRLKYKSSSKEDRKYRKEKSFIYMHHKSRKNKWSFSDRILTFY